MLSAARHKSKREVEHQIACLVPRPDAAPVVRRVAKVKAAGGTNVVPAANCPTLFAAADPHQVTPMPTSAVPPNVAQAGTTSRLAAPRPTVAPLASDRYLLRVTLGAGAHANLRRAQDLMRHTIPDGDIAEVIGRALTVLVDHLEKTRVAKAMRPRTHWLRPDAALPTRSGPS